MYVLLYLNLMAISRTYYEKKVRGGQITGLGTYWNHSWMHGERTMKYKKDNLWQRLHNMDYPSY